MMSSNASTAGKRLQHVLNVVATEKHVLDLPDGPRVTVRGPDANESVSRIFVDTQLVLAFRALPREAALVLSALGTPYEKNNPVPHYSVLELEIISEDKQNVNADLWASIYALWTLLHAQEVIPITFKNASTSKNSIEYLIQSGLARRALDPSVPELFLSRVTFWQGAGTGPAWNNPHGWLRYSLDYVPFPHTQSFTRSPTVITQHPLRPPKPPAGASVYSRFCKPIGKTLKFHMINLEDEGDMDAFHKWMNDPRVNAGWGEAGDEEKHRRYVKGVCEDPGVLPLVMSWDDEKMGYAELVWIKENHVATYVPGIGAQDYDRGLHVLVGENKYRGQEFSQAWFRSIIHYLFLADPRTTRIIGEPKRINGPIIKTSIDAGMHLETQSFYLPYKHSVMTMHLRERLFKEDMFL
ncbi:uncharacterized protein FOMMEDRAFT_28247 [Fomitiporia mediterranea MF3/22]|uniref:uncharacterized protein n=1 Tax=Fomitiporia mediterranea (strain MF3/22) TaxID=694068 RepID=UPI000440842E|nr:uncharacterized protein FOMMEDRAFT_28247 [Fomitiporia mediterranea MF3/22]EJD04589.1 hypothetical protein FOMMEDRAFT_28247 [Fomitiporia mediterranea MF3/22]